MSQSSLPQWGRAALKLLGVNASHSAKQKLADPKSVVGLRSETLSDCMTTLYRALIQACGSDAIVLPKIRLVDFLLITGGGQNLKDAIRMDRKCVDFLICGPVTTKPLAAVLLTTNKDRLRESCAIDILISSGIRVLRIRQQADYPLDDLRAQLLPHIWDEVTKTE